MSPQKERLAIGDFTLGPEVTRVTGAATCPSPMLLPRGTAGKCGSPYTSGKQRAGARGWWAGGSNGPHWPQWR